MVSKRYVRPDEVIGVAIQRTRKDLKDVQRPSGTERSLTTETAVEAGANASFAKDLAEQLETDIGPLPGQIATALAEAADALAEAGLARSDAAVAVSAAQDAVEDATQAIADASAASSEAAAASSAASVAQVAAGEAQTAADNAATEALAAANAASGAQATADSKGKTIIQSGAPAVEDRLPQNLWIDTTGGANTPKRWSGSDWVAVTDKTATDAAANAAAAAATASDAFDAATAAATAAGDAQTTANGKNRVWYLGTAPAGTGHKADDVWFNTAQGNRMARWDGSTWAVVEFGGAALANLAVTAVKLADDAVTSAKIAAGAVDDNALAPAITGAITTAQSTAEAAQTAASGAASAASAAQSTATAAQGDADQAIADALAAANAASGALSAANAKGKVIIQSAAPAAADRLPQNLWIDTTGGANTPKRWTTGTTWVAVTDKAATDAAAAAATAQTAANTAQSTANSATTIANAAQTAAGAAQTAADAAGAAAAAAQTSANGKAVVVRSTSAATAAGSYKQGDQWWQFSGANITGLWLHTGSAWQAQALTNSIIATLDAGKINTGYLAAARIEAATITGTHIAGATVTAANMVAGTITAASGIIANAAIGTAQIIDLAVSSAKIADLAVTNAKIANATIESAKIANLDAAKITTGTLNAARIASGAITTAKLSAEAVTAEKIAALAVTAVHLAAESVAAIHIAAGAVVTEKLAAGAVATDKLDALAVTAEKLAAGAVIAEKIAAGAITAEHIAANAIDAMEIRGVQIYGGYIEAPVIASSDSLGSGANALTDPQFQSSVNAVWALSGHAGDAATTQRDSYWWDQSYSQKNLYPADTWTVMRHTGNSHVDLTLTPAVRQAGSLVFANYSWKPAARTLTNPFTFTNRPDWMVGYSGGANDPSWAAPPHPTLATPTARTSYLTNSATIPVVTGERWNVRLEFYRLMASNVDLVNLTVEIINASTSAVLWSRPLLEDEKLAGRVNDWWDATFTGNVKYRIKSVYTAGGGDAYRKPVTGGTAVKYRAGAVDTSWSAAPNNFLGYGGQVTTYNILGSNEISRRAVFRVVATRALFAKVAPQAGWRLSTDGGFELFNSLGAQTGRLNGQDNYLNGRFGTKESGSRAEMVDTQFKVTNFAGDMVGQFYTDGTDSVLSATRLLAGGRRVYGDFIPNLASVITLVSGTTIHESSWLRKRDDGFVYGTLAFYRSTGFTSGATFASLNTGWRPVGGDQLPAVMWGAGSPGRAHFQIGGVANGVLIVWSPVASTQYVSAKVMFLTE